MNKRLFSIFLIITLICACPGTLTAAAKSVTAAYGTPVIDGEIDGIWSNSEAALVQSVKPSGKTAYKGWFKMLWDEKNLYVLAKVYGDPEELLDYDESPWEHDSFEVFIDEKNNRSTSYEEDDYQLRINFNGLISAAHYENAEAIKGAGSLFDEGYIVEMSFPVKTITLREGMTIGADAQINQPSLIRSTVRYGWNDFSERTFSNTSGFGSVRLVRGGAAVMTLFSEPRYSPSAAVELTAYSETTVPKSYQKLENVAASFDGGVQRNFPIILANDYPCMDISDLAALIGGSCEGENGGTLVKDGIAVKFTEGERLAEFGNGHLMLEREPKSFDCGFYVPISAVMPTLGYHIEFNRFGGTLEITSGNDYIDPDDQTVFYAADYGAVGDGVHDDGPAIEQAIFDALNLEAPARVELEPNKTYFVVCEKLNQWAYFQIEHAKDFTLDGKGSDIILEKPTNSFMNIYKSEHIQIKNLNFDYAELPFTQGRIVSVNKANRTFRMSIEPGYPEPAPDEWVKHYSPSGLSHDIGWDHGFLRQADQNLPKEKGRTTVTNTILSIEPVSGSGSETLYEVAISQAIDNFEVNDRFVVQTKWTAYNVTEYNRPMVVSGMAHVFSIRNSADVTIDGVYAYSNAFMFVRAANCYGRLRFYNSGPILKPGTDRVASSLTDGFYAANNRAGIIMENCTVELGGDDSFNICMNPLSITAVTNKRSFRVNGSPEYRIGDEFVFFDGVNSKILKTAYVTSCNPTTGDVTVDRDVTDVQAGSTVIYNLNAGASGSIIRNCTFTGNLNRAGFIRSHNTIYENNVASHMIGGNLQAGNETGTFNEGPFGSALTFRNNTFSDEGFASGRVPVAIQPWGTPDTAEAIIDGVLIEGNVIHTKNASRTITISHAKNVYLLNNTIVGDTRVTRNSFPILINRSHIAKIDGLNADYSGSTLRAIMAITNCKVDEGDITNINVAAPSGARGYIID